MESNSFILHTQQWVKSVVIGLNLCPFASQPFQQNLIRYAVTEAENTDSLWTDLQAELAQLLASSPSEIETSLLIHPFVLTDFYEYHDFTEWAIQCLEETELDDIVQFAGFHPDYQFAQTHSDSPENFTNRSPYPMIHILRQDSVSKAVETYPHIDQVPHNNIDKLREIGLSKITALRTASFTE